MNKCFLFEFMYKFLRRNHMIPQDESAQSCCYAAIIISKAVAVVECSTNEISFFIQPQYYTHCSIDTC